MQTQSIQLFTHAKTHTPSMTHTGGFYCLCGFSCKNTSHTITQIVVVSHPVLPLYHLTSLPASIENMFYLFPVLILCPVLLCGATSTALTVFIYLPIQLRHIPFQLSPLVSCLCLQITLSCLHLLVPSTLLVVIEKPWVHVQVNPSVEHIYAVQAIRCVIIVHVFTQVATGSWEVVYPFIHPLYAAYLGATHAGSRLAKQLRHPSPPASSSSSSCAGTLMAYIIPTACAGSIQGSLPSWMCQKYNPREASRRP